MLTWSIILGLIQGLTEFFPVSSSGHLALLPYIFEFRDPGLSFGIALHAGTFLAILFALKEDWFKIINSVLGLKKDKETKLLGYLMITAIPGGILGVLFEEKAETVFRNPLLIAFALIFFGLILFAVDKWTTKTDTIDKINGKRALIVGVSQALALIPGVSRSGATITAGRATGFSREAAVRYSFMAALPIIGGASIYGLRDVPLDTLFSLNWMVGFVASFVSSFIAIRVLLSFVKKHTLNIFLYWRLVLGVLIILIYLLRR